MTVVVARDEADKALDGPESRRASTPYVMGEIVAGDEGCDPMAERPGSPSWSPAAAPILQALLDAQAARRHPARGDRAGRFQQRQGLCPARGQPTRGVPAVVVQPEGTAAARRRLKPPCSQALAEHRVELIVLAGFMSILTENFTSQWPRRILNVHPSLIPSFCGKGFYGLQVHEAALAYGVKVTGATVHFVNEVPRRRTRFSCKRPWTCCPATRRRSCSAG